MEVFQMSQWLGRFCEGDGGFHLIFVGGWKLIGGSFVKSLVDKDHKEFCVEVQYLFQFSFNRIYLVQVTYTYQKMMKDT